jgi:hypothetical protein
MAKVGTATTGSHRRETLPRDATGAIQFKTGTETPPATPPTPDVPPAENPAMEDLTPDATDWSDVLTSKPAPAVFTRERVNVDDIPAPIRRMLETSFSEFLPATDPAKPRTANPKYYTHDFGSPERAEQFIKLAKQYGRYRREGTITVRASLVKGEPSKVRYCAKPLELKGARSKPTVVNPPAETAPETPPANA